MWYLVRDLVAAATLLYTAYHYIPSINFPYVRYFAWTAYGYIQGQQMTGIWVRIKPTLSFRAEIEDSTRLSAMSVDTAPSQHVTS